MLNEHLDFAPAAIALRTVGRAVIERALAPEFAEALHQALQTDICFDLKLRDAAGQRSLQAPFSQAQYAEALGSAQTHAAQQFAFAYEGVDLISGYLRSQQHTTNVASPALAPVLCQFVEQLNSPEFLRFARQLTAEPSLRRIDAQGTRYRAGHFLLRHNDFSTTEDRRFAYVMNLSKGWRADWGGLLQFFDAPMRASAAELERLPTRVIESVCPGFNTLTVFKVPQWHCVSPVAVFATGQRLAITGWMQA